MNTISKKEEKISFVCKVFFTILTVVLVSVILIGEKLLPENIGKYKYLKELTGDWTRVYADGTRENIGPLSDATFLDSVDEPPLTLEYTLDDTISIGSFLSIRSSSQAIYVYIDDILRVEYDNAKIRKWGSSNVSRYLFVPLDNTDAKKTLRVEYIGRGRFATATNPINMGPLDSLWYNLIQSDGISMLLEVMNAAIGLVMLIICAIVYMRKKFRMPLIWLALSMLNTSVYLLCYSDSRQLLFPNVTILFDFGFAFAAMTWISYLMYLNEFQKNRYCKYYNLLYILMLAIVLISTPLILTSVVDSLRICLVYVPIYIIVGTTIAYGVIKDIKAGLFKEYKRIGMLLCTLYPLQILLLLKLFGFIKINADMLYCLAIIVILCTDIFEEINLIIEDKAKVVRAESANEAKSAFLANMSHEIRTPINSIMGMNEMILRECNDPDILGYAGTIGNSSKFLLGIVNDILDFSKIEAGKMEIIPVNYSTKDMVIELTNILSERAANKKLHTNIDISNDLPSKLFGDVTRVKQVFINIISNACKYTKFGSVSMTMKWESVGEKEGFRVDIEDTGIGMKPEDCEKLFDKFTRLEENRNVNIEGTGLGMSIVKYLVSAMDGEINVESEYGKGTLVSIFLPQEVVSGEPIGDYKIGSVSSAPPKYIPKFTSPTAEVLVVDDVSINLLVFKSLLKKTAVNIDTAESGAESLKLCAAKKYDIIYMDHMMPVMDGEETLHAIRNMAGPNAETPVLVLTANAISGSEDKYLDMGFSAYLSKPIQSAELEQSLIDFLPKEKINITSA